MTITHEKPDVQEGWGALQFDYKFNREKPPGIYTTNYGLEGLISISCWMKSKYPCIIGLKLKDKKKKYNFMIPCRVKPEWRKYTYGKGDFKQSSGMKGRLETTRFDGHIEFRDVTPRPEHSNNILWIDQIEIRR